MKFYHAFNPFDAWGYFFSLRSTTNGHFARERLLRPHEGFFSPSLSTNTHRGRENEAGEIPHARLRAVLHYPPADLTGGADWVVLCSTITKRHFLMLSLLANRKCWSEA